MSIDKVTKTADRYDVYFKIHHMYRREYAMEQTVFVADPTRLLIAAAVGIIVLLVLIIRFKLHPVISMMIAAIVIGVGAGMPLTMISETVEKGVGKTLQGIALLVGLGSMFGGILEVSGGAQRIAKTLIDRLGQRKAGVALGITGLVIGTTVFFEAGVVVLIPLAFSVAKQTKKSTLYYAIPLLAGLASGYAFVPPSAGSVLVADSLGVSLGVMIMVGIPTALICMIVAGVVWGRFIGNRIFTGLPVNVEEIKDDSRELPPFGLVLGVILIPLILILISTVSKYMPIPEGVQNVLSFIGKPFLALTVATLAAMYFLGIRRGYTGAQLKKILDHSLRPVGMILLVIASGGVIRWMLQDSGLGYIIGPALEKSGMPLILVAFFIALLVRASVGSSMVAMTMASGIMATMPAVMATSVLYRAAMCCAICGGATALSHVNDAGFWLVGTFLEIDEKTTLKSWTVMETLIGVTSLAVSLVISIFA
ncbi:transporter, gluconate:H+ symporter family [[Bacteroides] pectinophilus ATCC 43243]|uniref:Gluconate permease n=2 Tax=[Bacteroides] pectinophilus TaxID=384638 RepID=B7AWY7_9FIRM|nr:transporter, gluconate:H+ symporter family [[Bacteroides] pectinophilus ATCC 43243]